MKKTICLLMIMLCLSLNACSSQEDLKEGLFVSKAKGLEHSTILLNEDKTCIFTPSITSS